MAEERKLDPHFVELSKAFLPGEYTDAAGNRIWYRLFAPALEEKKEYPLVVFLHGAGDRLISPENSQAMAVRTKGYSEVHLLPQAGHAESVLVCPEQYRAYVEAFLNTVEVNCNDRQ